MRREKVSLRWKKEAAAYNNAEKAVKKADEAMETKEVEEAVPPWHKQHKEAKEANEACEETNDEASELSFIPVPGLWSEQIKKVLQEKINLKMIN